MKKNIVIGILNIALFLLILTSVYAWMITATSRGEVLTYERDLIISSIDTDIELYQYVGDTYVRVTTSPIIIAPLAPNDTKLFRLDFINNDDVQATAKIELFGITGDIALLQDKLSFGTSYPKTMKKSLGTGLLTLDGTNYYMLDSNVLALPNTTTSIYLYVTLDKTASNEVAGSVLNINSIRVLKP